MTRFHITFIFIFISSISFSNPTDIHPILKKICDSKESLQIVNLHKTNWIQIKYLPKNLIESGQFLIKNSQGLYLYIDGTGRIYKLSQKGNSFNLSRIDSTYFTGYNFGSLFFTSKNSIYSFGGEGFWHTNGDLRKFDKENTHEWHAQKLNQIIYGSFSTNDNSAQFQYVDTLHHSLIITGPAYEQSHILKYPKTDSSIKNKLFSLNLNNGNWSLLGKKNFKNNSQKFVSQYGIYNGEVFIDFHNNKLYKYTIDLDNLIFGRTSNNKVSITFCIDSTVYYGNENGLFDSITISRANLIDIGQPAYIPVEETILIFEDWKSLGLALTSLLSFSLFFLIIKKKKKNSQIAPYKMDNHFKSTKKNIRNSDDDPDSGSTYRSGKLIELLNEQEKSFLLFLYTHSEDERMTTIEEINKKLGTSNKTIEIQKKMRSDMINGINNKLTIFNKNNRPVIDKQRSEFDKRSFEYFIHPDHMGLIKNIIKVNKI